MPILDTHEISTNTSQNGSLLMGDISNEKKLRKAFAERPEISTTFAVGFLHMDEVFERASESAHT